MNQQNNKTNEKTNNINNIINNLDVMADNIYKSDNFKNMTNYINYLLSRKKYYYIKKLKYNILYNSVKKHDNKNLIQKYLTKINGYNICLNIVNNDINNYNLSTYELIKLNELNEDLNNIYLYCSSLLYYSL